MWLLCAIGTGWGLFLVGSSRVWSVIRDELFSQADVDSTTASVLSDRRRDGRVIDYGIGIKKEVIKMIQAERFRKTIPEPIENLQSSTLDRNLNPNLHQERRCSSGCADRAADEVETRRVYQCGTGGDVLHEFERPIDYKSRSRWVRKSNRESLSWGNHFLSTRFGNLGSSDGYIALGSYATGR